MPHNYSISLLAGISRHRISDAIHFSNHGQNDEYLCCHYLCFVAHGMGARYMPQETGDLCYVTVLCVTIQEQFVVLAVTTNQYHASSFNHRSWFITTSTQTIYAHFFSSSTTMDKDTGVGCMCHVAGNYHHMFLPVTCCTLGF